MLALLALIVAAGMQAAPEVRLAGLVRDATSLPLPGAAIEIDGRLAARSDGGGGFEIVLPRGARVTIRISLDGFDPYESAVDARDGRRLDIVLRVAALEDHVSVAAPRPRERVEPIFARRPIDVYRTPGAQGDLFRALQALPGAAAPDDGAGLFVRGGDVSEVLVTLDDAVIAHPYRYETPAGGFRGAVDPMHVTGIAFATGGFSARHGNVLSAIVDLQGPEAPEAASATTTAGFAGASASIAAPVFARIGVRAAANRTFTRLLFAVNGTPRPFDPPPGGWDASAGVDVDLGSGGRMKAVMLAQRDAVGVLAERDAFVGWLRASSRHTFTVLRWDGAIGSWMTSATTGDDRYARETTAGVLDLDVEDRTHSWRIEAARHGGRVADWRIGVNGSLQRTTAGGRVPAAGGDLGGVRGDAAFDVDAADWFAGPFVETTATAGAVTATAGVRVDRFGLAHATAIDPRLNMRVALGRTRALRYATGLYHQAPSPAYYDRVRGAARLRPMRAVHHVIGFEQGRESEGLFVRAEGYLKRYADLPLEGTDGYASDGYGSARGLDLFAQWRTSRLDVRTSTSWMRARRRWTPAVDRGRYALPDGTWRPDFEIPWTMQTIATVPLGRGIGASASWRSAAGRLHTPIVAAIDTGAGLAPIFGARNSERLPRYERLDLSMNWLTPFGAGAAVFFVALDNALGRHNFFDYRYTSDYTSRQPVVSTAQRSLYAGVTYTR